MLHVRNFLNEGPGLHLALEPRRVYHSENLIVPARFALCTKSNSNGAKLHQELFDVSKLDLVVGQIAKMPDRDRTHFWISQATLVPNAKDRRISSIMLLNAVWVDIDIAHPPKKFDEAKLPRGRAEHMAALLAVDIEDAGLPPPTLIMATGGGLCPKWIFERAVSSSARPRWQSLQKYLVGRVGALQGHLGARWPVDYNACDAARILRLAGSHNPRWDEPCRIVWDSGKQFAFDYLADEILPYSREQVAQFRIEQITWKQWDRNRAAAAKEGIHRRTGSVNALIEDEAARTLWTSRFEFGRSLVAARGGAGEGHRNDHFWPLANALAWSCSSEDHLMHELAALHHDYFKTAGWTRGEAVQAAGSVLRRMGTADLYKMKTSTFLEKMSVTPLELNGYGHLLGFSRHNVKRGAWETGVMGFTPMKGLPLPDYIEETKRRQALAGARSADVRKTGYSLDIREKAVLMRSGGYTQAQIAAELGVVQGTVSKWLKIDL